MTSYDEQVCQQQQWQVCQQQQWQVYQQQQIEIWVCSTHLIITTNFIKMQQKKIFSKFSYIWSSGFRED